VLRSSKNYLKKKVWQKKIGPIRISKIIKRHRFLVEPWMGLQILHLPLLTDEQKGIFGFFLNFDNDTENQVESINIVINLRVGSISKYSK
jgi:hypothetical protein